MAEEAPSPTFKAPGQPFTFGGVARYAYARPFRLLGGALFFAFASGAVIAALFVSRWAPVIREAIANLPARSAIRAGSLDWPEKNGVVLGANQFISIAAAAGGSDAGAPVDFAFQFEPNQLSVRSLLGTASVPYPRRWTIQLNRTALQPLWGAWEKPLVPLVTLASALGLIASWSLLAVPYSLLLRLLALALGRALVFRQAWKLGVAAQWPGAILLSFVLALYAAGETTLLLVCAAFVAHFLLTFLYLCLAPFFLPRVGANPFSPETTQPKRGKNPFKTRVRD